MKLPLLLTFSLALFSPLVSAQEIKLLPDDGASSDYFGWSVAISGNTAIVGAYGDDDTGLDTGSAYLFDVTTGAQIAKLLPSASNPNDDFGYSVAISGNTAIVGQWLEDVPTHAETGAAYLFDANTGTEIFRLLASDGAAGDRLGRSVGISGNIAIVGAYLDDGIGTDSGSAYLFDITTGAELAKLLPSDGAASDNFGVSVAISANTAIVGAHLDDDNGTDSGSAYLFDIASGAQIAKLLPSDGANDDQFGRSVAISGNTAIVGAYTDDDNGHDSGSAYLFNATTGSQIAKLLPSDGATLDYFGRSVAISGNTAIVGVDYDDDNGDQSGSAYIFDASTGAELVKLLPGDGAAGHLFGVSVAISGNTAIVGAMSDDYNGPHSGSAYLFDTTFVDLFGAEHVLTTDASDAQCVISADLDGDGDQDIISAAAFGPLYWFENQGLGVFSAGDVLSTNSGARYLDASDLDQDGDLDVLVAEGNSAQIGWIENLTNGTGVATFNPFVQISPVAWALSVHAADLNNDTILDLVFSEHGSSSVFWKPGLGVVGGSISFAPRQHVASLTNPDKVISADLDQDGDLDLVSSAAWGQRVAWYENNMNAAGTPWVEHVLALSGMGGTHSQQATDIDGDGDLDLLFSCHTDSKIVWFENDGAGDFFQNHIVFFDPVNPPGIYHHYAGDLDGDGDPDIVSGMTGTSRVSYFINDGFGGFSHENLVSGSEVPRWVHLSDLDEDGHLDVLVASQFPGTISWYPNLHEGDSTSYCEALPNSVSPDGAQIRVNGRSSISTNEMTLRAQNLKPSQFGVFFFGPLTQDPPVSFGDGLRCVGTFGLSRLNPPVSTGSGTAQRVLDMSVGPLSTISAGNAAHFQFWYRDPPGGPTGFNLTDALSITFCP